MGTVVTLTELRSRRAFFRAAGVTFAGGGAMLIGACGGSAVSADASRVDVAILKSALQLENASIYAYTTALQALSPAQAAPLKTFLGQEREHAAAFTRALHAAGATASAPRTRYDIAAPKTRETALTLLARIEQVAVAAYVAAIPKIADGDLRATVASIATSEAEHLSMLRIGAGRAPLAGAFLTSRAA